MEQSQQTFVCPKCGSKILINFVSRTPADRCYSCGDCGELLRVSAQLPVAYPYVVAQETVGEMAAEVIADATGGVSVETVAVEPVADESPAQEQPKRARRSRKG